MTADGAEKAVTSSALVVIGIYAYRRFAGDAPTAKGGAKAVIAGQDGQLVPLGQFVTAWGFTFLVVSLMASVSPSFGGSFAILIATSDFLANAPALFDKVQTGVGPGFNPTAPGSVGAAATQTAQGAQGAVKQASHGAAHAAHAGTAGAGRIAGGVHIPTL